uniref:Uncharacterized protein n=1 Tax=Romanomermis culicivorax TaxID=13658 RepID=A0A915KJX0_ROMCU
MNDAIGFFRINQLENSANIARIGKSSVGLSDVADAKNFAIKILAGKTKTVIYHHRLNNSLLWLLFSHCDQLKSVYDFQLKNKLLVRIALQRKLTSDIRTQVPKSASLMCPEALISILSVKEDGAVWIMRKALYKFVCTKNNMCRFGCSTNIAECLGLRSYIIGHHTTCNDSARMGGRSTVLEGEGYHWKFFNIQPTSERGREVWMVKAEIRITPIRKYCLASTTTKKYQKTIKFQTLEYCSHFTIGYEIAFRCGYRHRRVDAHKSKKDEEKKYHPENHLHQARLAKDS